MTRRIVTPSVGLTSTHAVTLSGLKRAAEVVGYPCILKPALGSGSCLAYPAYRPSDVDWYVQEARSNLSELTQEHRWFAAGGWICETYLHGPLVTVYVVADGARIVAFGYARNMRQTLSECIGFGSIISSASRVQWRSVLSYAENCCRDIGLDIGVFDVEIIVTDNGPVLVEVNPRPPGGEMLSALSLASDDDIFSFVCETYAGAQRHRIPHFNKDVVIWKILSAEDGNICADVGKSVDAILQDEPVFHKFVYLEAGPVRQLDCIARVLIPTSSGADKFRSINAKIGKLASLIGVDLLSGNLPALPWEYGGQNGPHQADDYLVK
ncbi:ATP-grasp domain-containing protein [Rhizobium leguminosarum]|uniref:ATP-grasp domain-containing protein n=1 Tax=Rhizobium leguminosarum TaxID=384 RepID=UPI003F98A4F0